MYQTQTGSFKTIRTSRLVNKSPFFYGWVIMLAGTLGMVMTSPGQTFSVSIFIEHFITDLGISRSLVSTLYTVGTLVGSFALPILGRQIDKKGPRLMVVAISAVFGVACIYMGFIRNALMLGLGFIAIRMLGQGGLGLVSQNVINQWWVRRRGTVMGISGMMMALLGVGAFPTLINELIARYGWRLTYPILGAGVLLIMVPLGLIFFRNRPEDYGLRPDGAQKGKEKADAGAAHNAPGRRGPVGRNDEEPEEENWTLAQAMHTPVFWVFVLSQASVAMLSTGLFFHMVSIFADNNLSAATAASVFVPIAITTAAINLLSGMLVDRISVRFLLSAALLGQAISLIMAQYLSGIELALLYGVVLGTTSGLMRTVGSVVWATYFGRLHLGTITGTTTTILIAGSALGPMPLGIARDVLGSYNQALTIAAFLPLILAVVCLFFDRPRKEAVLA